MIFKKTVLVFISIGMLTACNNASDKKETDATETNKSKPLTKEKPKGLQEGCYVYNTNRSTISLQVTKLKDSVSGTLLYALAEKDKNTGRFVGTVTNNLLVANYTFESEGVESIRQVAFKIKHDTLIEGYGETIKQGDKQVFKNLSALQFNSKFPLVQKDCID